MREYQRLENTLGRKLTQREVEAIASGLAEQAERYDQINAEAALKDYHEQGGKKLDVDNNKYDRQAWMVERLQDSRTANEPNNSDGEYDLDDKKDRIACMTERLNGTEFDEVEVQE
ncbi:MAG TPA: hypothetical protein VFX42_05690 [Gemmatimonadales bacterium]|nr:hypothetical protein [Gemmatimonadales bacterium]